MKRFDFLSNNFFKEKSSKYVFFLIEPVIADGDPKLSISALFLMLYMNLGSKLKKKSYLNTFFEKVKNSLFLKKSKKIDFMSCKFYFFAFLYVTWSNQHI